MMDYVLKEDFGGFGRGIAIYYFDDTLDVVKTVTDKREFNLFAEQNNLPVYGDFDAMLLVYMDDFVLQLVLINGRGVFDGISATSRIVYYVLNFAECKDKYLNLGVNIVDAQMLSISGTCIWQGFDDASISENISAVAENICARLYGGVFLSNSHGRDPMIDLKHFGQVFVNLGV